MSNFLTDLEKQYGPQIAEKLSSHLNIPPKAARKVLPKIGPQIIGGMREQARSSSDPNAALMDMIRQHGKEGALDDLDGHMQTAATPASAGDNPLAGLLGGGTQASVGNVASKLGISPETAAKLLPILLPIILGVLQQKTRAASGGGGAMPGMGGGSAPQGGGGFPGMDVLGQILGRGKGGGGTNQSGCLMSLLGRLLSAKR